MKVEIKVNKHGDCEVFKLNGQDFGQGIYSYNIIHQGGRHPTMFLETSIDELIIDGEKVDIFKIEKEDEDK